MKIVNGYTVNEAGQLTPWSPAEEALLTTVASLIPDAASVVAGNLQTLQHRHSQLSRSDDSAIVVRTDITGYVSIGTLTTTPDSLLHIHTGTAGAVTAFAGTQLTIENNGTSYLSFLTTNINGQGILFGNTGDNFAGYIIYTHNPVLANQILQVNVGNTLAMGITGTGRTYFSATPITPIGGVHIYRSNSASGYVTTGLEGLTIEKTGAYTPILLLGGPTDPNEIQFTSSASTGILGFKHQASPYMYMTVGGSQMRFTSGGQLGIANDPAFSITATAIGNIDSAGKSVRIRIAVTPANSAVAGNTGEIMWDANYIYVYTGAAWRRATLAAF